jgi:hypothetical protein
MGQRPKPLALQREMVLPGSRLAPVADINTREPPLFVKQRLPV